MPPAKTARKTAKKTAPRAAAKKTTTRRMSAAHEKALAAGRTTSAKVGAYLAAINTPKRRGRKVTKAALENRLVEARAKVKSATGVDKVLAAQSVRDLQSKIAQASVSNGADLNTLEAGLVKIAKTFGENRGIGYGAWRDSGVPADVLKKAGIARTRG